MKIKHLLIGLFAVAATVACMQEQPAEMPKLEVDKEAATSFFVIIAELLEEIIIFVSYPKLGDFMTKRYK